MGKSRGNCTWGAGILAHKGVCSEEELARTVSVEQVDLEFERRVSDTERIVRKYVNVALNQAQFDALCSLTYNAGPGGAGDTFGFATKNDFAGAAANISKLIKVTVVVRGKRTQIVAPGLIKRRAEESAPFRVKASKTPAGNEERDNATFSVPIFASHRWSTGVSNRRATRAHRFVKSCCD